MLERRGSVCGTRQVAKLKASLRSTGTGQTCQRPRNAAMVFFVFPFSLIRFSSPSRCFSERSFHLVIGGMVLTSEKPHGFVFSLSLFFPPSPPSLCAMCVLYVASSITPASEEGERGNTGRQAGRWERPRRDRMVPRCHDGVDGSECTARWVVQGAAGHCLGYVLHNACTCCAVLAPYSTTPQYPDQLLFIIHHCTRAALCAAASISAQVGWRTTAMTKTKRGRQERDARYCI